MRTDYERLAGRYDEDRAAWSFPPDAELAGLLATRPAARVLDLGCGTGRWLAAQRDALADPRVTALGVDPSSAMLAEARAKGVDAALVRAAAEALPIATGAVDYLVCSYAFHHFADKDRALDEVSRVLAPGGVFRIDNIEPAAAHGWWVYEFFPETVAVDAARFWPAGRVGEALEARGFTVDIDIDAGPTTVRTADALADAERRVLSQLAVLPDDAYERGLARLRAVTDATVPSTRSRLCLIARR